MRKLLEKRSFTGTEVAEILFRYIIENPRSKKLKKKLMSVPIKSHVEMTVRNTPKSDGSVETTDISICVFEDT